MKKWKQFYWKVDTVIMKRFSPFLFPLGGRVWEGNPKRPKLLGPKSVQPKNANWDEKWIVVETRIRSRFAQVNSHCAAWFKIYNTQDLQCLHTIAPLHACFSKRLSLIVKSPSFRRRLLRIVILRSMLIKCYRNFTMFQKSCYNNYILTDKYYVCRSLWINFCILVTTIYKHLEMFPN